jgi:hypothetical protein
VDWAENYAILLSVFNLSKDDIKKSTIPFLNGLLNSISKIAELKQRLNGGGCPLLGTGTASEDVHNSNSDTGGQMRAPTMSEIENFFGG